jgi:hypothetical protein
VYESPVNVVFPFCNPSTLERNKFLDSLGGISLPDSGGRLDSCCCVPHICNGCGDYYPNSSKYLKFQKPDLATAMAISGAAIAPDLGYVIPAKFSLTRGALRIIFSLFNMGIGRWVYFEDWLLPNRIVRWIVNTLVIFMPPILVGIFIGYNPSPNTIWWSSLILFILFVVISVICFSVRLFEPEYLSWLILSLNLNQLWLPATYLSDGGHYENLGLLGLLQTLKLDFAVDPPVNHTVLCFDASEDSECSMPVWLFAFEQAKTLGYIKKFTLAEGGPYNIAKERSRFSNERWLKFTCKIKNVNVKTKLNVYCVKSTILRTDVGNDSGRLVTLYSVNDEDFPHTSTSNQWIAGSFKYYVELGKISVDALPLAAKP